MKVDLLITMIWGVLMISGLPLGATDYFNPADYQYNMTITGTVQIDGVEISTQDTLFAFVGDQYRGLISPKFETEAGQWFVYLVVHGQETSEQINFKYYDETSETLIDLKNSVIFEIDKIMGTAGNPYIFSDQALSVEDNFTADKAIVLQFKDVLIIDLKKHSSFEIIDLNGKIVFSTYLREGRTEIPMHGIQRNIYILRIYNQTSMLNIKIKL